MSIYTLGIDVGSTASKCIILKDGKEIVAKSLVAVGTGTSGPARSISEVLENAHMKKEDMAFTLATGYGRNSLEGIADKQMSELSCHAMGASFIWPNVHTVIDIGGQDVKVIHVENGTMTNFQMNDKCSAGTGKFLEIMANRLGVTINELFDMAAAGEVIPISSLCTVFAESEVINYIGEGKKREDIAAGVVDSVANKVVQLAQKKELGDRVILTGGLSHSIYFTGILSDKLDQKVESEEFGRFAGAYGAALLAREKKDKRR